MKKTNFIILITLLLSINLYGQFGNPQEISTSTAGATDVIVSDLDNDGYLDVISASFKDNKIAWYKNNGFGVFEKQKNINIEAEGISSIFVIDINNDGYLDIISASAFDDKIAWYKNDGLGNFGEQLIISINADFTHSVFAKDIDGDGNIDVISASAYDDKIAWYKNDGAGNFGSQQIISVNADYAMSIFACDIDGDNDVDIISASSNDDKIAWYENDGNGNFGSEQIISINADGANVVFAVDIDGDSDMDILSTSYSDNKIAWYENDGNGNFGTQQIISTDVDGPSDVSAADIDNDNKPDVISVSKNDNKIAWYKNDGLGNFGVQQIISTEAINPYSIFSADINEDGNIDIFSASFDDNKIAWYENDGSGNFGTQQIINISDVPEPSSIFSIDLDGDNILDILFSSLDDNKIAWYKNYGSNSFGSQNIISNNVNRPSSVYSADIDNDGDMDVLSASINDNKIAWYENDGTGNFGSQQIITLDANLAYDVYSVDIDGDGDMDVLSASANDDKIAWYENDGLGNFGTQQIITQDADGADDLYSIDVDGDGDFDVLSASAFDDKIAWYENDGTGNFGAQQIISVNADHASSVYACDIDNDGDIDVLSASMSDNKIAWYENDGTNSFGTQQIITINTDVADHVYAADIDDDGDLDVISTSSGADEKIAWYENNGNGDFGIQKIITSKLEGEIYIHMIDIDYDGDIDAISASSMDDRITLHENYLYGAPNKLKGNIFFDFSQNGIKDSVDYNFIYVQVELQPNELSSFTNQTGDYWFAIDTGNYIVSYNSSYNLQNWHLTTDSTEYHVSITTTNSIADSLDFGFYPDSFFCDINPELTASSGLCSENTNYWINYQNIGTTNPNGVIELILDTQLTYITATITPDSIIGNYYYWHFDTLNYFAQEMINLTVQLPDFNSMGDTLSSFLNIYTNDSIGQFVFSDLYSEILLCSYDPNDKLVTPKGEGAEGVISKDDTLEYTVRFQNTGNAEAINIKIRDQIDEDIDITSMKILASSHNVQSYIEQNRWLVFQFDSIMLPDTATNFLESQGFVKYSVKLNDGVLPNAKIYNTANIFFDYNPAVITNTTVNTVECYITPTAPEIYLSGNDLVVNTNYNLQWYLNDSIIFSATDSVYTPTQYGNYTVEVFDDNGCSSFSDVFIFTNINNIENTANIKIYPNPSTGIINISADNIKNIEVLDMNGKLVFSDNKNKVDLSKQPKGIYFIRITTFSNVAVEKLILE